MFAAIALATFAHATPQEANGYTRYELLAPGSGAFRIVYDITAVTRPGATAFFNPIRKGSVATDESCHRPRDRRAAEVRGGALDEAARAGGLDRRRRPRPTTSEVHLARPVPLGRRGGAHPHREDLRRLRRAIASKGDQIVFDRSLGIKKRRRRAAGRLWAGVVQLPGPGPARGGRPAEDQLPQHHPGGGAAAHPRPAASPGPAGRLERPAQARGPRGPDPRHRLLPAGPPETHSLRSLPRLHRDQGGRRSTTSTSSAPAARRRNPSARNLDTGEAIPARNPQGRRHHRRRHLTRRA